MRTLHGSLIGILATIAMAHGLMTTSPDVDLPIVSDETLADTRGASDTLRFAGNGTDCNSQQGSFVGSCTSATDGQECIVCEYNDVQFIVSPSGNGRKLRNPLTVYCSGLGRSGTCRPKPDNPGQFYCYVGQLPNEACVQGTITHYDFQPEDP